MIQFIKKIGPGEMCPRFYGLYGYEWITNRHKVAIMPFNVPMAITLYCWQLMRNLWIPVCVNRHDAYRQGRQEGYKEAQWRNSAKTD